jgi:biopolymer transport protein ExbD
MLAARRGLEAHLPDPNAALQSDAVPIVLEVGPRGHYAINREVVPGAELPARLHALYAARPDKRIIVEGARDARYQEVIRAMDIARGAGVTVIGVGTRGTR